MQRPMQFFLLWVSIFWNLLQFCKKLNVAMEDQIQLTDYKLRIINTNFLFLTNF